MTSTSLVRGWKVFVAATTLLAMGCSRGAGGDVGALRVALVLPGDVAFSTVTYTVTGNGIVPRTGAIPVEDTTTATALVTGLPSGSGYTVAMLAVSRNTPTVCEGVGTFAVTAGQTTIVPVTLQCRAGIIKPGAVAVTGRLDSCPVISDLTASSLEARLGQSVAISVVTSDTDGDTVSVAWTQPSSDIGSIDTPWAASTTFTCRSGGTVWLSVAVSDGICGDSRTNAIPVTCDYWPSCASGACGPINFQSYDYSETYTLYTLPFSHSTTHIGADGTVVKGNCSGVATPAELAPFRALANAPGTLDSLRSPGSCLVGDFSDRLTVTYAGIGSVTKEQARFCHLSLNQLIDAGNAVVQAICARSSDGGAGSSGGGGAGGAGGSDGGLVVPDDYCISGDPGGPACNACAAGNCALGPTGTDGCCGLQDKSDVFLCFDAINCFAAHPSCVSSGDPTSCFCGTSGSNCFSVAGAANGPCAAAMTAAAKTTTPSTILDRFVSPAFPLGRAVNLTACRGSFCAPECSQ